MSTKKILCAFFFLFLTQNAMAFTSEWQASSAQNDAGKVRLIGSYYFDAQNKKKLILGLQFKLGGGWKIYGQNSNGMGLSPTIDFKGSSNLKNHLISWPQSIKISEKIGKENIEYEIYKDEVILPIEIIANDNAKKTSIDLKIDYGLCKDVCIPAAAQFKIELPDEVDEKSLQLIQKFFDKKIATNNQEDIAKSSEKNTKNALFYAIFAAILGGLILNIMPCVLPVLGIKLMSVINHNNAEISRIRIAFFASIIGIVFCFMIFASFAAIISYTGNIFNWGLQFQNPYFLIFLIIILLFFVANLIGFFEITFDQFLANFIDKKISTNQKKQIFMPNFLSGILAVLLATPCSAPFLGSAISFSIMQTTSIIFLIFFAMSFGFALPYAIFMISPKLINCLPKAGNWMIRVKEGMGILLGATVIWLIYILSHNLNNMAGFYAAIISLLLLSTFKIRFKFIKFFVFCTLIGAIFALPSIFTKPAIKSVNPLDSVWKKFDENELQSAVASGKIVVIDVTADWCLTCKFNKINVLHDKEVLDRLNSSDILAMRADITKPNKDVMTFINHKDRFAIPFNAVYGPHAKDGLLTNELLSKKELLHLIEEAK